MKAREENPTWGGRKLRNRLLALVLTNPLSDSNITEVLRRWQTNFKDEFALSSKLYCNPLTLLDDHSRISLCIDACGNHTGKAVRQSLERTFIQYGMPFVIYVDNGTPWGNNSGIFAHTRVSIWLMRHDIQIIHGKPYHPQGRRKLERFHRTLKQEVLQGRQFGSLSRAQKYVNLVRCRFVQPSGGAHHMHATQKSASGLSVRPYQGLGDEGENFTSNTVGLCPRSAECHSLPA